MYKCVIYIRLNINSEMRMTYIAIQMYTDI